MVRNTESVLNMQAAAFKERRRANRKGLVGGWGRGLLKKLELYYKISRIRQVIN